MILKSICGFTCVLVVINLFGNTNSDGGDPVIPKVKLLSGYEMPMIGFGCARLDEKSVEAISTAVKLGYRLLDTAKIYNATEDMTSEGAVGNVVQKSGIPREEFFIVTKITPAQFSKEECRKAIEESLVFLRTSYIDLVLIHSPVCDGKEYCVETGTYLDGWKCLEELVDEGKVRSIGGSNYRKKHIAKTLEITRHPLSVLQNFFDPYYQDKTIRTECKDRGIAYMGYSTLGAAWFDFGIKQNVVLGNKIIKAIAKNHSRSAADVVLRWANNKGVVVIPGTTKKSHIAQNIKSLNFDLTGDEIQKIDSTDKNLSEIFGGAKEQNDEL